MDDTTTQTDQPETGAAGTTNPAMVEAQAAFAAGQPADQIELAKREEEWKVERDSLLTDTSNALQARDAAEKRATDAEARADKAEAALTKAKARVKTGDAPTRPRKLAAMVDDDASRTTVAERREALQKLIADADKVEIAFSDGKKEIAGLAPIVVEGDVWREHTLGLMLRDPVTVAGPAPSAGGGGTSVAIAGYALLLDGKQVAYTVRSDALNIAPGQKISLQDDIYF